MSPPRRIAVLLYHHVGPVTQPHCRGLTVTPRAFARQIGTLKAMGWNAILPAEWANYVHRSADIPPKSVMITFDDAFADLSIHALPILEKHSFEATVFVPTSLIGGAIACSPRHPEASLPIMDANQIAAWAKRGISFGAHSRSHIDLTTADSVTASDEIERSGDELAMITGKTVRTFAYPYGIHDTATESLVRARYETAFTIEEGMNDIRTPLTALRRTMVQHTDSVVDVLLRARYGKSVFQRTGRPKASS
ncbi:MAG: polysaccharide deacetylase family protein [Gemmatimonadaceae bacterium]